MLKSLDGFCFLAHTLLIVFNLIGWAWRPTRRLHRLTVAATLISWLVLGANYGWGYCVCTDWHFAIRRQLGYRDPESSYIQLLFRCLFHLPITRRTADLLAVGGLATIVLVTATVWIAERKPKPQSEILRTTT